MGSISSDVYQSRFRLPTLPVHVLVASALALSLLAAAIPLVALPASAQSGTEGSGTPETNATADTNTTGETNATATPVGGTATVIPCEEIREDPTGEGPDYRVVEGPCEISIANGEILSNVWFKAGGARIDIDAYGSGWTIRNVAITGHGSIEETPLDLRVQSREGVGLVTNVWVSDVDSNALYVHASHSGKIVFDRATFLRTGEDAAYASRPGNPPSNYTDTGMGGIVGFERTYVKRAGIGGENPKAGYGLRLGSDGSYIRNSTIVSTTGPAVANTFAGGQHPNQYPGSRDGVVLEDVDILTEGIGIRLNNHQEDLKDKRNWTAITTLRNVDIEAGQPIQRNEAGGVEPIVNGEYGTDADPSPPAGAPRSPVRAASGVGGGTGSIGGEVTGPDLASIVEESLTVVIAALDSLHGWLFEFLVDTTGVIVPLVVALLVLAFLSRRWKD